MEAKLKTKMVRLLARVTDDGYLIGATDDFANGWRDSYWYDNLDREFVEEHHPEIVEIEVLPEMVKALLDHGTSAQEYPDGYKAWDDVLHRGRIPENGTEFEDE